MFLFKKGISVFHNQTKKVSVMNHIFHTIMNDEKYLFLETLMTKLDFTGK